MDNRAIGIFDSGAGGLTALKYIHKLMPNENIVYLGDTINSPYGKKSKEDIVACATKDIEFLRSKNVKIALAACGTISAHLNDVKCDVPTYGIIEPLCRKAFDVTRNGNIGVLATQATIDSGIYVRTLKNISRNTNVYGQPCPELATMIENGHTDVDDKELIEVLESYLSFAAGTGIDTLILGCTHYPIVEEAIRKVLNNPGINIINSGKEIAVELERAMQENDVGLNSSECEGKISYYISGCKQEFLNVATKFLDEDISNLVFHF